MRKARATDWEDPYMKGTFDERLCLVTGKFGVTMGICCIDLVLVGLGVYIPWF